MNFVVRVYKMNLPSKHTFFNKNMWTFYIKIWCYLKFNWVTTKALSSQAASYLNVYHIYQCQRQNASRLLGKTVRKVNILNMKNQLCCLLTFSCLSQHHFLLATLACQFWSGSTESSFIRVWHGHCIYGYWCSCSNYCALKRQQCNSSAINLLTPSEI